MEHDPLPLPPIERRIATGFGCIARAMRSQAWAWSMQSGLTPTQAAILALLAARGEPLRLSAIVEQVAVSAATASEAVGALVAKALVEKTRARDDHRAIALRLTRAGLRVAAQVAEWGSGFDEAAATLSAAEKAALLRALVKMIGHMQEHGDMPPVRMCATCRHFEPLAWYAPVPYRCSLLDLLFDDAGLRIDCPLHESADAAAAERNRAAFAR